MLSRRAASLLQRAPQSVFRLAASRRIRATGPVAVQAEWEPEPLCGRRVLLFPPTLKMCCDRGALLPPCRGRRAPGEDGVRGEVQAGGRDYMPGAAAAGATITIDVGTSCVHEQVGRSASKRRQKTDTNEQLGDELLEEVMRAQGDATRRDGDPVSDALSSVGEEVLEDRGALAGQDQPIGDVCVRDAELMQVGVRLPFIETEVDLPTRNGYRRATRSLEALFEAEDLGLEIAIGIAQRRALWAFDLTFWAIVVGLIVLRYTDRVRDTRGDAKQVLCVE